jgi:prepilin-type processing-associated H-X9-DG protein
MKRRGFTLWEIIGVFALVAIVMAVAFPFLTPARQPSRKPYCQNNLKQIGIALIQYNQDFKEYYPPVSLTSVSTVTSSTSSFKKENAFGWADALLPYARISQIFQCRDEKKKDSTEPTKNGFTDYWVNNNAAGKPLTEISIPARTIALGDGDDGRDLTDARYNLPSLPIAWIKNQNSPAYRHKGMANYAFLDGHVKALPSMQVTNEPLANGKATFAVR